MPANQARTWGDRPLGFAHRGARTEERENTIVAFRRALDLGASGLESDAWLTSDGVVVLDHDGVLGPIWRRRSIAATPRRDLPGHIPSLDDLYAACGSGFELSLDVKDSRALEGIVAAAREAGAATRLWLCSSDWRPMAAWRALVPEARLVESTNLSSMLEGPRLRLAALRESGIDAVNLHRSEWNAEVLREVRAAGLLGLAWDVQSARRLSEVIALGIDALYCDDVALMTRTIGDAEPASPRGLKAADLRYGPDDDEGLTDDEVS